MSSSAAVWFLTANDYLAGEAQSQIKHEYRAGQVFAMTGVRKSHAHITSNLTALIHHHLDNTPCAVFGSDMKVRIEASNCFYYPDLAVSCSQRDLETNDVFLTEPLLILEILSKSTRRFDQGAKFLDYQQLASLREYVLISQERRQVDCFRLQANGEWLLERYESDMPIRLVSIGLTLTMAQIYQRVIGI
jgi:Uma2 family endonuclease